MRCLSGLELYSRWVPLMNYWLRFESSLTKGQRLGLQDEFPTQNFQPWTEILPAHKGQAESRGGGGYSPIKVTGVLLLPFRGLICGLVSLSVLKPKMTATRVDTLYEDKDLWQCFHEKSLRRKCPKVIFITIKICSASYIICCCWVGTAIRGRNEFGTRP